MPIDIVRTQETNTYDRNGGVVKMLRVVWFADKDHGPYVDEFPVEMSGFDQRQALEARAAQIATLRGV